MRELADLLIVQGRLPEAEQLNRDDMGERHAAAPNPKVAFVSCDKANFVFLCVGKG
jgi:hypothetical protein